MSIPKTSLPPELAPLNDQPGCYWPPHKREELKAWLGEAPQLRSLLLLAYRRLGRVATVQDAEDAWGNYYGRRLDTDIDKYDPTKGLRFWPFLRLWFGWFCLDEGTRLRQHYWREAPLRAQDEEDEILEVEFADETENADPVQQVGRTQIQQKFPAALNRALDKLPRQHREAFVWRYIRDLSEQETAERMAAPVGSVKGWCHRAIVALRRHLQEEGWKDELA